ncbi:RedV protein [Streptomyces mauvecolor]|uniref:RedV protein n=1 Tax=Streptomyces mauvecolor TaxID=58345 RepID=A0ABV9UWS1_9ACTN
MTPTPAPPARPSQPVSFDAALRDAMAIAVLAPSSHNCQPWGLAHFTSPGARRAAAHHMGRTEDSDSTYLALALDRERSLVALPAHDLEMLLSCGAYWWLLLRALGIQGWAVAADGYPDHPLHPVSELGDSWPSTWALLAVVELRRHGVPDWDSLAELRTTATERHTNRAPYRKEPVDNELLFTLGQLGDVTSAGTIIRHFTGADERAHFVRLLARHGGRDFSHTAAWRETHSFVRRDEAAAQAAGDGFALSQLFGPMSAPRRRLFSLALAPATMRTLRPLGYHRVFARGIAAAADKAPATVAMSLPDEAPGGASLVRAGGDLVDYWLRATRAGLAVHPVSVLLQHDDLRRALQSSLGLSGRTVFVARLGRPTTDFPAAPRLDPGRSGRRI